jgi:hypothetical protein
MRKRNLECRSDDSLNALRAAYSQEADILKGRIDSKQFVRKVECLDPGNGSTHIEHSTIELTPAQLMKITRRYIQLNSRIVSVDNIVAGRVEKAS